MLTELLAGRQGGVGGDTNATGGAEATVTNGNVWKYLDLRFKESLHHKIQGSSLLCHSGKSARGWFRGWAGAWG
jgi:hypothetical protein